MSTGALIGAAVASILVVPGLVYGAVWYLRAREQVSTGGRPEPPEPNHTGRVVPGSDNEQ
ncbi:hypothetical protein BRC62_05060 [Halobacteriales archaeon QH_10_67_13]|nr:MAG: hypothetical protein BRC62_05060 [Halobacteriales archaeon QH_10_67_13]